MLDELIGANNIEYYKLLYIIYLFINNFFVLNIEHLMKSIICNTMKYLYVYTSIQWTK